MLVPGEEMHPRIGGVELELHQPYNLLLDPAACSQECFRGGGVLCRILARRISIFIVSTMPLDPSTEGGVKGFASWLQRKAIPQEYRDYMNALTRLRGVITGIRGFTGANNSDTTSKRLLAELPNFNNTGDSTDAALKLQLLRQELTIIKRLGYFLPDSEAPTGDAGASSGAATPPPGAVVRDFTQIGPR